MFSGWEINGKSLDEYWEYCLSGLSRNSNGNELQRLVETLKKAYDYYTKDNYQFEHFKKLWEELELWENGEENIQLTCAPSDKVPLSQQEGKRRRDAREG